MEVTAQALVKFSPNVTKLSLCGCAQINEAAVGILTKLKLR
jgi:hypothetical protein